MTGEAIVDDRRVLIVMPAWNESACVRAVVSEVREVLPDATVLVVDDGSGDATADEAAKGGALVLQLPIHLGVGGAMRAGYKYAQRNGFDVAVQVDADGQHDPREVATLLAALDDADVVIGARFAGVGDYRVPLLRRVAMRMLARTLSRRLRARLSDTTSGFRAANRRAIDVFAGDYPAEYLGDTVEALVIAHKRGCRVVQVPVRMRERLAGEPSHSPVKAAVYLLRAGLVLLLSRTRR